MSDKEQDFVMPPEWGLVPRKGIPKTDVFLCDKCRHAIGSHWIKMIVGFTPHSPVPSRSERAIGAVTVDCPHCHSKMWKHAWKETIEAARLVVKCWPKDENGKPL
jgi:hypothetical protein